MEKRKEKEVVNKRKIGIYIIICGIAILVLAMALLILSNNSKSTNDKKEEESQHQDEEKKEEIKEEVSVSGIDIGKLKDIVSFGVISIDEFTKGMRAGEKISRIVAYTSENKIINIYTLDEEYFKNVVANKKLGYTPIINDIDYDDGKLYILIHDEVYYIDLLSTNYKLEKINYTLPSPYYCIYVLDNIIYFNDELTSEHLKYNINTKQVEKLSDKMTEFVIKKDTKEIIYGVGDITKPHGGQDVYIAPINDMENTSKKIYSAPGYFVGYFSYDSKYIYFTEQEINNGGQEINSITYNITLGTYEKEEYTNEYEEDEKIGNQTIIIDMEMDTYTVLDDNGNESNLILYEVDGTKIEIKLSNYSSYWYDLLSIEKKVVLK